MNIYKVWTDYFCHDGADGFIVVAKTAEDAVERCVGQWCDAEGCEVKVGLIGVAFDDALSYSEQFEEGIILSSFNAG